MLLFLPTLLRFRPYHFEYAIENGKHVFMEKPVATDPVGVRKVLDVARVAKEKRLNVVVGVAKALSKNTLISSIK